MSTQNLAVEPSTEEEFETLLEEIIEEGLENDVDVEGMFTVWEERDRLGWDVQIAKVDCR